MEVLFLVTRVACLTVRLGVEPRHVHWCLLAGWCDT